MKAPQRAQLIDECTLQTSDGRVWTIDEAGTLSVTQCRPGCAWCDPDSPGDVADFDTCFGSFEAYVYAEHWRHFAQGLSAFPATYDHANRAGMRAFRKAVKAAPRRAFVDLTKCGIVYCECPLGRRCHVDEILAEGNRRGVWS